MTLRLVHYGNALPDSYIVDPSAEFISGMVAQLAVIGNQVMATVSNGVSPIGVIDDIRTKAFTNNSWNEVIIAKAVPVIGPNGGYVTPMDIQVPLHHPQVIKHSFATNVNCILNANNGLVIFKAGTPLNFDLKGSGQPDAIRAIVSYTYYVANIPGEDSTAGSGRVTIWYDRMRFQTDQFETNQQYPLGASLYVSERGLWTSRRPSLIHPSIGMVTGPPIPQNPMLEIILL